MVDSRKSTGPEGDETTPFAKVKQWLDYSAQFAPDNFDRHVRQNVRLLSAEVDNVDHPTVARSTFLLRVVPDICNAGGTLHGGFVALAFDMCTSMTISPLRREGFWDTGHVTRSLNCTYLRPAPAGSEVLIECEVVHLGKRVGLINGVMRSKETGKILFTCQHDKACTTTVYQIITPAEDRAKL